MSKINELLNQLTLDEKISMLAGADLWHSVAIPRLGIPQFKVTDGPNGAFVRFGGRPPVAIPFFAFRIMVGIGVLMLAVSWYGAWRTRRGRAAPPWLLWVFAAFTFAGWVATLAGWIVTEMGRQPWLVTGVLRTKDAVGDISGAQLGASLTGYILTYALLFVAYMVTLTHMAGKGTDPKDLPPAASAAVAMPRAAD